MIIFENVTLNLSEFVDEVLQVTALLSGIVVCSVLVVLVILFFFLLYYYYYCRRRTSK